MIAQEFILIPKDSYIKKQPRALDVLDEPAAVEKANVWLSSNVNLKGKRNKRLYWRMKQSQKTSKAEYSNFCLCSKQEKSKSILDKMSSSNKISIDDDGKVKIDDRTTAVDANLPFWYSTKPDQPLP